MIHFSTAIVSDTIQGALILSVFDFIACFFVLYFISFFIRGITYLDERILKSPEGQPKPDAKPIKDNPNKLPPGAVK